jgi:hypothetical protein
MLPVLRAVKVGVTAVLQVAAGPLGMERAAITPRLLSMAPAAAAAVILAAPEEWEVVLAAVEVGALLILLQAVAVPRLLFRPLAAVAAVEAAAVAAAPVLLAESKLHLIAEVKKWMTTIMLLKIAKAHLWRLKTQTI